MKHERRDVDARIQRMRSLVAVVPLALLGACGATGGEPDSGSRAVAKPGVTGQSDAHADLCLTVCPPDQYATLDLSCPAVVTSIQVTGACEGVNLCRTKTPAAAPCPQRLIDVVSSQPGICHLELTLEGGFQTSTDVTFVQQTFGGTCPCANIVPAPRTLAVDVPSASCADAGIAEGGADAGADVGFDVQEGAVLDASQDVVLEASDATGG
jgi:hypothetical protein